MNEARFLGLDLAWSERNPSGLAAIDAAGRVIDVHATLRSDDEILGWVRSQLAPTAVLGIDMPTIVRNPDGARRCERELRAVFGRYDAGPHPANLARFPDGGRARRLLDRLATDDVVERTELGPRMPGRFAFEVFPHPAHVRLFSLPRIFRYKKKSRAWEETLSEWARYRAALAGLARALPPLLLPDWIPAAVHKRGYKAWEDSLDALTCAYVASFLWHWGTAPPHARVFGDLAEGYIIVPNRAAVPSSPATLPHTRKRSQVFMSPNSAKNANSTKTNGSKPFLTDVTELRRRARENMDKGALTEDYKGDVAQAVELLNGALATEIVCVLRYTMHWVTATGIASDAVKEEFKEHADEEREHMEWIADRIDQLGGTPDFDPKGLASRSSSEYGKADLNLVEMIKENLVAERIAIEHYRELVEYFGANDPTSRRLMEKILAKEEEHATDMHDLLVAHEGRPFLKK